MSCGDQEDLSDQLKSPDERLMAYLGSACASGDQLAVTPMRFTFIDGLRGLAATSVMLYHFSRHRAFQPFAEVLPSWMDAVLRHGGVGVPVFFVISGFVIAHSVGRARVTAGFIGHFALRRSIRLDPPCWAAIAVLIGTETFKELLLRGQYPALPTPGSFAAHATYTFEIFGFPPILPVYWTLCHEVQFYLLYCLLLGGTQKLTHSRERWPAAAFALTGVFSALDVFRVQGTCLSTWYMFAIGVMLYYAYTSQASRQFCIAYFAFVVATLAWDAHPYRIATVVTAVAVTVSAITGNLTRWLSGRIVQYLGGVSYSLYLIHGVIGWQVLSVGNDVLKIATPLGSFALLLIAIGVSLVAAHLMRLFIELPSIAFARRFKRV